MLTAFSLLSVALNSYFYLVGVGSLITALVQVSTLSIIIAMWWRDVIRESTYQGKHTQEVTSGLYFGMILFIASEVMFFFSFFFSFFFLSLNPSVDLGMSWPPKGILPVSFTSVPLLNTLLLLSSGVSVTWSHYGIVFGSKRESSLSLLVTIFLGVVFMLLQVQEYFEASFTFADSVFGSLFFVMTGFHGIHVLVGNIFLAVSLLRLMVGHFSKNHHLGFEMAAWYWHFVDVVWLGLFVSLYWWGS